MIGCDGLARGIARAFAGTERSWRFPTAFCRFESRCYAEYTWSEKLLCGNNAWVVRHTVRVI